MSGGAASFACAPAVRCDEKRLKHSNTALLTYTVLVVAAPLRLTVVRRTCASCVLLLVSLVVFPPRAAVNTISVFVGNAEIPGLVGNGDLGGCEGLAFDTLDRLFIADTGNHQIKLVTEALTLELFAGDGTPGVARA